MQFVWNAQNRLTSILSPYNERTTLTYDALDRELKKTLANGMALSHTYDAAGRETLIENRKSTGAALVVYTSTYDVVDNRLTVQELDGVRVTYAYDASYQLVNEQRSGANAYQTTYTYDGVGNRLTKQDSGQVTTSSYNAANALTLMRPASGQPTTSTYDGNGNLLVEQTGNARTTYTWDTENRLTNVSNSDGTQESNVYSADGHRQKSSQVTAFVWDEENVLMELNPNLSPTAQYTDFPGYWGGLVSERRGSVSSYYGFDPQASARILVSVGGVITDSYTYKSFGEELAVSGSTQNPHRYIGRFGYYRDIATRLSVRARVLRVDLGRWMSRDPIRFSISLINTYNYVDSNAVVFFDPSGKLTLNKPSCRISGDCECDTQRIQILEGIIADVCTRTLKLTKDQWGNVVQCANDAMTKYHRRDCPDVPGVSGENLMRCFERYCGDKSTNEVLCADQNSEDCKKPKGERASCAVTIGGGITVCVDVALPCMPKPVAWNKSCQVGSADDRVCKQEKVEVSGREGLSLLLHELAHACHFVPKKNKKDKCAEYSADFIACCIMKELGFTKKK